MMSKCAASHVLSLMRKDFSPLVEIKTSSIGDHAGKGVFASKSIRKGQSLSLYPGRHTPPLPLSLITDCLNDGNEPVVFHETNLDANAYIMNLPSIGGYIDGSFLGDIDINTISSPQATGQLINHPSKGNANVIATPFLWKEVLRVKQQSSVTYDIVDAAPSYLTLPNSLRNDGSHWYLCPVTHSIVRHPERIIADNNNNKNNNNNNTYLSIDDVHKYGNLAGALISATGDIAEGEELLLDYALKQPLPSWAKGWYFPCK
jgi:hypothetical protein